MLLLNILTTLPTGNDNIIGAGNDIAPNKLMGGYKDLNYLS